MLHVAKVVPFVYHYDKIRIFHFDNYSTRYHLAVIQTVQTHAQPFFLRPSVFSGSSEISKYLYYSTDNCVLTWGGGGDINRDDL